MIPKRIYTIWLSEKPMPELVTKCIASQKIPGYQHILITLDNCDRESQYVRECIEAKHWVKASDYLRMYYLYTEGGIYLDADMEILPGKNFDHLLNCKMYIPKEECGHAGNCGLGAEPRQQVLKTYLDRVENNFKGSGDLVYDPGIRCFSDVIWLADKTDMIFLPPHVFFPYNHQTRKTEIKPDTLCFHHFMKSWVSSEFFPLPLVSIIIPSLGRPEGLKRCLASILASNYPQHMIETLIIDGEKNVPLKVQEGYEKAHANLIIYAANDMEFDKDCIRNAVEASKKHGLIAFNSGKVYPDEGNICAHFLIRRDIVEKIGQIFNTRFHHVGVDNLLWAQCKKMNEAYYCNEAKIIHHHFSSGAEMDSIYRLGWSKVDEDRKILQEELARL